MAKSGSSRRVLVIVSLFILVIAAFIGIVYLLPGETYLVHVTVINNASSDSAHPLVYVINHGYSRGDTIEAKYLYQPGSNRTYDLKARFAMGTNASYTFRVIEADGEIDRVSYVPGGAESNVTATWDGANLHLAWGGGAQ